MKVNQKIAPPAVIGIIGGGQLGRMSALAARAMGYRVIVLEPKHPCACSSVVEEQIQAAYDDPEGLKRLFQRADVVTFEFENIQREPLEAYTNQAPIRPSPDLLWIAQNREREKSFLNSHGLPVAPFRLISEDEDVLKIVAEDFVFPAILKTAAFGYDGKGQINVTEKEKLMEAWHTFEGATAVLEERIDFVAEYSVIVARSPSGETQTYPLCRNIHRNHILDVTFCPPLEEVPNSGEAGELAKKLAIALGLEGIIVVELFLTRDKAWIINEMAPRPHNSGHFSIDGSDTSQFENHIRAVCNQTLGLTKGNGFSAMQNLLGETLAKMGDSLAEKVFAIPGTHLHLYDKGEAKNGRKMGHINLSADSVQELKERLTELRDTLGLPPLDDARRDN